nr:nucleotide-binding alpha-beta plait domain-containing protein [Tanacetum cinerariifolium]
VDRFKFHANIARFHRAPLNSRKIPVQNKDRRHRGGVNNYRVNGRIVDNGKSFANVVKNTSMPSIVGEGIRLVLYNEGVVDMKVEGVPFKFWAGKTFNRIAAKWGDLLEVDDMGENFEVPETVFDDSIGRKENVSDDPFRIYSILNKNNADKNDKGNTDNQSFQYPSSFTPIDEENGSRDNREKSANSNVDAGDKGERG